MLKRALCLLRVFGGRDASIPPEAIDEFDQTLAALDKECTIHVYPDADHGFFRHGGTDRTATEVADAWDRVRSMLGAELPVDIER